MANEHSRSKELALFVGAGGLAAIVNVCSRALLSQAMGFALAVTLAYGLGIITAFVLQKVFVFPAARTGVRHQALWFVAINILGLLQTLVVSVALNRWLLPALGFTWHPELVAHLIGVAFPIAGSYVGHKYVTFAAR